MILRRLPDGRNICPLCDRAFVNLKQCGKCGQMKTPAKKLPDGTYLCRACHEQQAKGACPRCGHFRPLVTRVEGQLCCTVCRWEVRTAVCRTCQRFRPIVAQGQCGTCYTSARRKRLAIRVATMAIGTTVYHVGTKVRGVIRGKKILANQRGWFKRLQATSFLVQVWSGAETRDEFWPALKCRLVTHARRRKSKDIVPSAILPPSS